MVDASKNSTNLESSTNPENQEKNKEAVVVDASAILSVLLGDEQQPPKIKTALQAYAQEKLELIAPTLLKFEVGNALRSAFLRDRLSQDTAKALYDQFLQLPISYVKTLNLGQVLALALKKELSFYDASYLFLAQNLQASLLTLDKKLVVG